MNGVLDGDTCFTKRKMILIGFKDHLWVYNFSDPDTNGSSMNSSACPLSKHVALIYGIKSPPFIRSIRFCDSETAVRNGIQGWSLPSLIWSSVWYNSFCLFFLKYCNKRAQMNNSATGQWLWSKSWPPCKIPPLTLVEYCHPCSHFAFAKNGVKKY